MQVTHVQNVCQALPQSISYLMQHGKMEDSRAGKVLVAACPMLTITEQPQQRVLFSQFRDANPIFHLAEAIWMLAGRSDAAFLNYFIKDFGQRFAEESGDIHDAYGRRWRETFGFDQLQHVIEQLRYNPQDRQAVITMWDPRPMPSGMDDLRGNWRSKPCNDVIFLRVRDKEYLDMTICCRSNDMLWGAHGANAVHFSILQEYLAARIKVQLGKLYQLSNNAHCYLSELETVTKRLPPDINLIQGLTDDRYQYDWVTTLPMFDEPSAIDGDIFRWFEHYECGELHLNDYRNEWFYDVLSHAVMAHKYFKVKKFQEALRLANLIAATDWREAIVEWIDRRIS